MKKWLLLLLTPLFVIANSENPPFPFHKETNHFQSYCNKSDQISADAFLAEGESYFTKLSKAFQHEYPIKISLIIYPNIERFHEAIDTPQAPSWCVSTACRHQILIVSLKNPGLVHTYQTLLRCEIVSLSKLFMKEKYPRGLPGWLSQGAACYLADFYSNSYDKAWIFQKNKEITDLPSFAELEQDETMVGKIVFYNRSAFSLVDFIKQKWGWEKILALMEDYSSFEGILKVSKEDCRKEWIVYLDQKSSISSQKNPSN
jgi:hypothetical protein